MLRCSVIIFLLVVAVTACGSTPMFPADGLHVPTPSYPSEILGTITEIGDRLLVEQEPGATIGNRHT